MKKKRRQHVVRPVAGPEKAQPLPPAAAPPSPSGPTVAQRFVRQAPSLLVLLAVAAVFVPICGHDFVNYDDNINVYANGLILRGSVADLLAFWTGPHEGLYIPVTYSLWWLLARLGEAGGGPDPRLFHAAGLLLHLAATYIVFLLCRRLVGRDWPAAAGALLFGLHPVQVEPVAWVTGTKDVLAGFFALAALHCHLRAADAGAGPARWRRQALALVCYLLAVLAKPTSIAILAAPPLLGVVFLGKTPRRSLVEVAPWLAVALPLVWITTSVTGAELQYFVPPPWWQRALIAGDALAFYAGKLLLPLQLGPDYGRTPALLAAKPSFLLTGILPWLCAAIVFWKLRGSRPAGGLLLFLLLLLPVSGFIPFPHQDISTVADRYLYLPLFGLGLAAGAILVRAGKGGAWAAGLILAALAVRSALLVPVWQDAASFNAHALQVNPDSWIAHNNLGGLYYQQGKLELAEQEVDASLRVNPDYHLARRNKGRLLEETGRIAEAIGQYRQVVRLRPDDAAGYFALGRLLVGTGDLEGAEANFRRAAALAPDDAEVRGNLGGVLYGRGRFAEAAAEFAASVRLDPESANGRNALGAALLRSGRPAEAISHFEQALRLEPGFPGVGELLEEAKAAAGRE